FLLDSILQESGHFLEEFSSMPLPSRNWTTQTENNLIAEQLDYCLDSERERAESNFLRMNSEQ
ncbi:hypothetical protein F5880DRAFT_1464760, partial [Lentinula raphanica]